MCIYAWLQPLLTSDSPIKAELSMWMASKFQYVFSSDVNNLLTQPWVTISTLASIRSPFIQKHCFLALLPKLPHCIALPVLISLLAASSSCSQTLPFIICHAPFSSVAALLPWTHNHHFCLGQLVMVTMFLVHYVFVYTMANVDQPAWANIILHDLASSSITWHDLARLG